MSWLEGVIVEFRSEKPELREARKVRTREGQPWPEMHYFRLDWARRAGYPDEALADGCPIRFEPDPVATQPRVKRFAPYRPQASAGGSGRTAGNPATLFLNPYHFLPLEAPREDDLVGWQEFLDRDHPHDRFGPDAGGRPVYSGRIVCRLLAEGPLVVGGEQERDPAGGPARVHPCELPDPDAPTASRRPAVAGSTLRGLLAALVEAATASALRVLGNDELTYRPPRQARRTVPGTLHGAVSKVAPDLVPFHPGRERLTPAERLFGVVEHEPGADAGGGARPIRALAGRVRVAHALALGERPAAGWYDDEATLKILASPKPPCPPLYFGNHGYLRKDDLRLGEHEPQGRKVYLHHRREDVEARRHEHREGDDEKQHMRLRVRPLPAGTAFLFHLDFTNLTADEVGILLYALRPTPEFRHKLGLGKPLGLGRVRLDPLAVAWVHRRAACTAEGLFGPRFAARELLAPPEEWDPEGRPLPPSLEQRYAAERGAAVAGGTSAQDASEGWPAAADLAARARARISDRLRPVLERVGDPASVEAVGGREAPPVHYPLLVGQRDEEHFRWFVANDKRAHQHLEPIDPDETEPPLPPLRRL